MSLAWSVSASAEEPASEEGVGAALGAEEVEVEGTGWCAILLLTPGRRSGPG